jgi:hypothetical protein
MQIAARMARIRNARWQQQQYKSTFSFFYSLNFFLKKTLPPQKKKKKKKKIPPATCCADQKTQSRDHSLTRACEINSNSGYQNEINHTMI